MNEEPVPCPFCGESDIRPSAHAGDTWVWCKNPKCPIYDVEIRESEWNTRPDSKPEYKWGSFHEWWVELPYMMRKLMQGADIAKVIFNAARERKE